MKITHPQIEEYAGLYTTPEGELLRSVYREAHLKTVYPRMVSGPVSGKFLEMISGMIKPSYILEIGTFNGYSALCLARGLRKGGILHTIECNPEYALMAAANFRKAGVADCILLHTGDALTIIPSLDIIFDLVFIDAGKEQYPDYYRLVVDKVAPGGYILADNVLWDGKVVTGSPEKETLGIIRFNELVHNDPGVENLLLPFRDGIMIIKKLQDEQVS